MQQEWIRPASLQLVENVEIGESILPLNSSSQITHGLLLFISTVMCSILHRIQKYISIHARHDTLRDVIYETASSAALAPPKEERHLLPALRLPQSKTYCVEEGRREFVFDCGVIGMCPPCTRATPLAGVFPCWWVDGGGSLALRSPQ